MITKFSGNNLWFTSDTHFGHKGIIQFCSRPFDTVEDHDRTLIDNWNSVVGLKDTVFHLGDFCYGNPAKMKEYRNQLNGHIILIKGNHDDRLMNKACEELFDYVTYQMKIIIDGKVVFLNHFPFLCFEHDNPDVYTDGTLMYSLFGHVHSRPNNTSYDAQRLTMCYPTQYDVGVDNNYFTPISWENINKKIQEQISNWHK